MRASFLFLVLTTVLMAFPAADAHARANSPGAPAVRGPAAPNHRGRGGPTHRVTYPSPSHRPSRPVPGYRGDWPYGHGHHGHGDWGRIPWWYYLRYFGNYYMPYGHPVHPVGRPGPIWMHDGYYRGSDYRPQTMPPVSDPPASTPSTYGTDAYAGDPSAYGMNPYVADSSAYDDPYAEDVADEQVRSPYYEADPVQFSYTPADIPQRPAVVRPDRESLASLIVPSQARMPLYDLVVMPPSPPDTSNPLLSSSDISPNR